MWGGLPRPQQASKPAYSSRLTITLLNSITTAPGLVSPLTVNFAGPFRNATTPADTVFQCISPVSDRPTTSRAGIFSIDVA